MLCAIAELLVLRAAGVGNEMILAASREISTAAHHCRCQPLFEESE